MPTTRGWRASITAWIWRRRSNTWPTPTSVITRRTTATPLIRVGSMGRPLADELPVNPDDVFRSCGPAAHRGRPDVHLVDHRPLPAEVHDVPDLELLVGRRLELVGHGSVPFAHGELHDHAVHPLRPQRADRLRGRRQDALLPDLDRGDLDPMTLVVEAVADAHELLRAEIDRGPLGRLAVAENERHRDGTVLAVRHGRDASAGAALHRALEHERVLSRDMPGEDAVGDFPALLADEDEGARSRHRRSERIAAKKAFRYSGRRQPHVEVSRPRRIRTSPPHFGHFALATNRSSHAARTSGTSAARSSSQILRSSRVVAS